MDVVQKTYLHVSTQLHDLVKKVGVDLSTFDILVQSNIAAWKPPNFTIMEAWLSSTKAMALEVQKDRFFVNILTVPRQMNVWVWVYGRLNVN